MNILRKITIFCLLVTLMTACSQDDEPDTSVVEPSVVPPFRGTPYVDPDIITKADSSTFVGLVFAGRGSRIMYDRRENDWVTLNVFLFDAAFGDSLFLEVQVNPEFGSAQAAEVEAVKYATVIGQLPTALRSDVRTVSIHKGDELYGGGNNNILIHTGMTPAFEELGALEEILAHEAAHTSMDKYSNSSEWSIAQESDGNFISKYARDYPNREDMAETFLMYLAVRYRSDRIEQSIGRKVRETIPNRLVYLDSKKFDMYPIE